MAKTLQFYGAISEFEERDDDHDWLQQVPVEWMFDRSGGNLLERKARETFILDVVNGAASQAEAAEILSALFRVVTAFKKRGAKENGGYIYARIVSVS